MRENKNHKNVFKKITSPNSQCGSSQCKKINDKSDSILYNGKFCFPVSADKVKSECNKCKSEGKKVDYVFYCPECEEYWIVLKKEQSSSTEFEASESISTRSRTEKSAVSSKNETLISASLTSTKISSTAPEISYDTLKKSLSSIETTDLETTDLKTTDLKTTDLETTDLDTTDLETTYFKTTDLETTYFKTTDLETSFDEDSSTKNRQSARSEHKTSLTARSSQKPSSKYQSNFDDSFTSCTFEVSYDGELETTSSTDSIQFSDEETSKTSTFTQDELTEDTMSQNESFDTSLTLTIDDIKKLTTSDTKKMTTSSTQYTGFLSLGVHEDFESKSNASISDKNRSASNPESNTKICTEEDAVVDDTISDQTRSTINMGSEVNIVDEEKTEKATQNTIIPDSLTAGKTFSGRTHTVITGDDKSFIQSSKNENHPAAQEDLQEKQSHSSFNSNKTTESKKSNKTVTFDQSKTITRLTFKEKDLPTTSSEEQFQAKKSQIVQNLKNLLGDDDKSKKEHIQSQCGMFTEQKSSLKTHKSEHENDKDLSDSQSQTAVSTTQSLTEGSTVSLKTKCDTTHTIKSPSMVLNTPIKVKSGPVHDIDHNYLEKETVSSLKMTERDTTDTISSIEKTEMSHPSDMTEKSSHSNKSQTSQSETHDPKDKAEKEEKKKHAQSKVNSFEDDNLFENEEFKTELPLENASYIQVLQSQVDSNRLFSDISDIETEPYELKSVKEKGMSESVETFSFQDDNKSQKFEESLNKKTETIFHKDSSVSAERSQTESLKSDQEMVSQEPPAFSVISEDKRIFVKEDDLEKSDKVSEKPQKSIASMGDHSKLTPDNSSVISSHENFDKKSVSDAQNSTPEKILASVSSKSSTVKSKEKLENTNIPGSSLQSDFEAQKTESSQKHNETDTKIESSISEKSGRSEEIISLKLSGLHSGIHSDESNEIEKSQMDVKSSSKSTTPENTAKSPAVSKSSIDQKDVENETATIGKPEGKKDASLNEPGIKDKSKAQESEILQTGKESTSSVASQNENERSVHLSNRTGIKSVHSTSAAESEHSEKSAIRPEETHDIQGKESTIQPDKSPVDADIQPNSTVQTIRSERTEDNKSQSNADSQGKHSTKTSSVTTSVQGPSISSPSSSSNSLKQSSSSISIIIGPKSTKTESHATYEQKSDIAPSESVQQKSQNIDTESNAASGKEQTMKDGSSKSAKTEPEQNVSNVPRDTGTVSEEEDFKNSSAIKSSGIAQPSLSKIEKKSDQSDVIQKKSISHSDAQADSEKKSDQSDVIQEKSISHSDAQADSEKKSDQSDVIQEKSISHSDAQADSKKKSDQSDVIQEKSISHSDAQADSEKKSDQSDVIQEKSISHSDAQADSEKKSDQSDVIQEKSISHSDAQADSEKKSATQSKTSSITEDKKSSSETSDNFEASKPNSSTIVYLSPQNESGVQKSTNDQSLTISPVPEASTSSFYAQQRTKTHSKTVQSSAMVESDPIIAVNEDIFRSDQKPISSSTILESSEKKNKENSSKSDETTISLESTAYDAILKSVDELKQDFSKMKESLQEITSTKVSEQSQKESTSKNLESKLITESERNVLMEKSDNQDIKLEHRRNWAKDHGDNEMSYITEDIGKRKRDHENLHIESIEEQSEKDVDNSKQLSKISKSKISLKKINQSDFDQTVSTEKIEKNQSTSRNQSANDVKYNKSSNKSDITEKQPEKGKIDKSEKINTKILDKMSHVSSSSETESSTIENILHDAPSSDSASSFAPDSSSRADENIVPIYQLKHAKRLNPKRKQRRRELARLISRMTSTISLKEREGRIEGEGRVSQLIDFYEYLIQQYNNQNNR